MIEVSLLFKEHSKSNSKLTFMTGQGCWAAVWAAYTAICGALRARRQV